MPMPVKPVITSVEELVLGLNMPVQIKVVTVDSVELSTYIDTRFDENNELQLRCDTTIDIMVELHLEYAAGYAINTNTAYSSMSINHTDKEGVNFADIIELTENGVFAFDNFNDRLGDSLNENTVILSNNEYALNEMSNLKIGSFEKCFRAEGACVILEDNHAYTVAELLQNLLNGSGEYGYTKFNQELREEITKQVRAKAVDFLNKPLIAE